MLQSDPINTQPGLGHSIQMEAGRGSNQSAMRDYNERLVLSLIRQSGPMPKAEIARATGLSAQTVSVIMRALEKEGLLTRREPLRGKVGQPAVPMGLAQDGALFLGLKVGRNGAELALCDFFGKIRHHRRVTYGYPTPEGIIAFTTKNVEELMTELPDALRPRVAGLGIALPFRLWDWEADKSAETAKGLAHWRIRDIAAELRQKLDMPAYLCNDASAACGAELVFGDQAMPSDYLYAYIDHFVGGGLVLDHALHTGRSGNAAAIASLPVSTRAGQRCQLVDLASLATLERMLDAAGEDSGGIRPGADDWDVAAPVVDAWVDQAAHGLAQAVVASSCVFDFETMVIDGAIPRRLRNVLIARTQTELQAIKIPGIVLPTIREGTIGYDAKVRGAASLPLSNRYLVDRATILGE
ncbi:ROK family transcriptional regulator [Sulfitobacter sp. HI0023]|uniref:ROK family transcriptional regulator n=1 Tax=Sulfitobacter sp. HI0023 TaxID=1822225 RepID=UPI000AEB0CBC|nr:ROK family transcriptional regulator [Sulfitobacter sp. HI0023]